jgi:Ca2+-transporting ATPase
VLTSGGDLIDQVRELTLLAMVGIVDPPRPEARVAIAECHDAGIQVRMITGDHATTAAAIAGELGIEGRAVTGTEFAAMSDEQLMRELDEIGVIARVAPEDKVRLVRLLKEKGNVVAMTGDGVNDAPALKTADIGVAMGITGTEVSKEAAVMILTDDNFATIVKAVEYGRALYDNLAKYIRFQMTSLVAFITAFLGAALFGIAGGIPFSPLQVLWINFAITVPIAIALGFDQPSPGLMERKPRPLLQPVLSRVQWLRIVFLALIMAAGTLLMEAYFGATEAVLVATLGATTFSLFHIFAGLSCRSETQTAFSRDLLADRRQVGLYGLSVLLTILATELGFLQRVLGTQSLDGQQWLLCVVVAASVLVADEVIKLVLRLRRGRAPAPAPAPAQALAPA